MLKTYGVLGNGNTNKNVIEDALRELGTDNEFIVACGSKTSESESRVLNWLIDMEMFYKVIHAGKAPEAFLEKAMTVHVHQDAVGTMLKLLKSASGTLLLLWDDAQMDRMEEICIAAADSGIPILDLTNGLVPIMVTGEDTQEQAEPTEAEEVEIEPFSHDEMMSMSIGVLRKTAKSQGIAVDQHATKEDIVKAIMSDKPIEVEEEEILPPIELGTFHVVTSAPTAQAITSSYNTCMLTATFPSGVIMSRPANVEEVKQLFGFGATV
ncbi:hypothetical protein UFOVP1130_72 [uncultured Caudovirales phage]|uniref:Uncharacterized protein n=1 Tax=uncultured Caudovirales phage TaxID=2100421 RepID=A0A6J5QWY7_9CAUD|nr:hypothetical protein UFOVP1130_72 [uncultured Caudovirales phage]